MSIPKPLGPAELKSRPDGVPIHPVAIVENCDSHIGVRGSCRIANKHSHTRGLRLNGIVHEFGNRVGEASIPSISCGENELMVSYEQAR
jgi:hypothetical protein